MAKNQLIFEQVQLCNECSFDIDKISYFKIENLKNTFTFAWISKKIGNLYQILIGLHKLVGFPILGKFIEVD